MTPAYNIPLRNVRLYGKMGTLFGRHFRLAVASPAEAVRALCRQLPGFERYLMESKDNGFNFAVFVGKKNLEVNELTAPSGNDDIRIAPILTGSKRGGIFGIIVGAVLTVVGVLVTPFAPTLGVALVNAGIAMMIGGVVQLLTPIPKGNASRDSPENTPSYAFNGAVNTQAQGNPVPILYGELIVGSAVISAGISAVDNVYVPTSDSASSGANGQPGGGGSPVWHNEWRDEA